LRRVAYYIFLSAAARAFFDDEAYGDSRCSIAIVMLCIPTAKIPRTVDDVFLVTPGVLQKIVEGLTAVLF